MKSKLIKKIESINLLDIKFLVKIFSNKKSLFRIYQNYFLKKYGNKAFGKCIEIGSTKINNSKRFLLNTSQFISSNIIKNEAELILDVTNMESIDSNSIDSIVAVSVIEHVYNINACFDEIKRVLKPDGTVLITVPFGFPLHDNIDYYRLSPDFFFECFKDCKKVEIIKFGGLFSVIINSLQRPSGKLSKRYLIYKLVGFFIGLIGLKLDRNDGYPLGLGVIIEK